MALADRDVCGSVFNIMFKANQNFDKLFHFHIYVFLLVHGDVAYECLYLIDLGSSTLNTFISIHDNGVKARGRGRVLKDTRVG